MGKKDPLLAGEGAISLMERIWPSLQGIDGSSGSLGNAVTRTLDDLIPLLIAAPADLETRTKWTDRLYEAVSDDGVDYLSPVEDQWGDICGFVELANNWADRLLPLVSETWTKDEPGGWGVGATLCLSCLVTTKRYDELAGLMALKAYPFWHFDKVWADALLRQGRIDEAISFAEVRRKDRFDNDGPAITEFCERVLRESDRREEAYDRYGLFTSQATTNLATFRSIAKKYPEVAPEKILVDLINIHGVPGKWFAAAKNAGLLEIALECARDASADPSTLIRAARDFADHDPGFAAQVAKCALQNLLKGGGYEPLTLDIMRAYQYLQTSASNAGISDWANQEVEHLLNSETAVGREPFLQALEVEHRQHQADASR